MNIETEILRRKSAADKPYIRRVSVSLDNDTTIAELLDFLNSGVLLSDPVGWECSCKQKKCGACAMIINGRPRLACDTRISEFKKGTVRLEPLRKFPVVRDLIVDRSVMWENLKNVGAWLEGTAEGAGDTAYEASKCLQCGCCLEICPNFYAGGEFYGGAALTELSGLMDKSAEKRLYKQYDKHFYKGCGKSLACRDVCPAGINSQGLLVRSNAAAIWKRKAGI